MNGGQVSSIDKDLHDLLETDLKAIVGRLSGVESWSRLSTAQRTSIIEARKRAEMASERLKGATVIGEEPKPPGATYNFTIQGTKLVWQPVPQAEGYKVYDAAADQHIDLPSTAREWIPPARPGQKVEYGWSYTLNGQDNWQDRQ